MRKCAVCKKSFSATCFSWKNKAKGLRTSYCKSCHSAYRKKHYLNNRQKYIDKARKNADAHREILLRFIKDYLIDHSCVDCGDGRLAVLDIDHVRGKKKLTISQLTHNGHSLQTITEEIAKCEVRCSNCHRIKTAERAGWWKSGLVS